MFWHSPPILNNRSLSALLSAVLIGTLIGCADRAPTDEEFPSLVPSASMHGNATVELTFKLKGQGVQGVATLVNRATGPGAEDVKKTDMNGSVVFTNVAAGNYTVTLHPITDRETRLGGLDANGDPTWIWPQEFELNDPEAPQASPQNVAPVCVRLQGKKLRTEDLTAVGWDRCLNNPFPVADGQIVSENNLKLNAASLVRLQVRTIGGALEGPPGFLVVPFDHPWDTDFPPGVVEGLAVAAATGATGVPTEIPVPSALQNAHVESSFFGSPLQVVSIPDVAAGDVLEEAARIAFCANDQVPVSSETEATGDGTVIDFQDPIEHAATLVQSAGTFSPGNAFAIDFDQLMTGSASTDLHVRLRGETPTLNFVATYFTDPDGTCSVTAQSGPAFDAGVRLEVFCQVISGGLHVTLWVRDVPANYAEAGDVYEWALEEVNGVEKAPDASREDQEKAFASSTFPGSCNLQNFETFWGVR